MLDEDGALAVTAYDIKQNGRIVVNVEVNGAGPFQFALDTAASISVIFETLRNELQLDAVPGFAVVIHGIVASGQFPLLQVDSLDIGSERWVDARMAGLPGDTDASLNIDGILGVDFLERYAVGFSTRDRAIRLYPPELVSRRNYRGWTSVPLRPDYVGDSGAALYFIELIISGRTIPAIFDLGAGLNVVNQAAADRLGLTRVRSKAPDVLSGAIGSARVVAKFKADEVTAGQLRWRNEEFLIADLEIFATLMQADTPFALVGAGLFTQRDFIIDFNQRRLLVKRPYQ